MIETNNLIIRKFTSNDWKDLSEILTDEKVVYYEPYDVFTVEQCKLEAINFSKSDNFYAVELKSNSKVIGKIYFNNEHHFDTFELGYTFNAKYQGLGYAKESSLAIMDYAFKNLNARRIVAYVDTTNERSWHLLERLGMSREGCNKATSYKFVDENNNPIWKDTFSYAILKDEFYNKKSSSKKDFITPPNHVNFLAKKIFDNLGSYEILDGSIAYLDTNGGGPLKNHSHEHKHLFIVIKGQAKVILDSSEVIINENESYLVESNVSHSVWNNISDTTIMLGITLK